MPTNVLMLKRASSFSNYSWLLLKIWRDMKNEIEARKVHCLILKSQVSVDTFLSNHLINSYGKLGKLTYACNVFHQMPQPNLVSWNTILSVYSKSGQLSKMREVFNHMPWRDEISWTLVISGHACHGACRDSVKFYGLMLEVGFKNFERITILTKIIMSSFKGSFFLGQQIHGQIMKFGFGSFGFAGIPLVGLYTKEGLVHDAKRVFDEMEDKNVIMCNMLITGFLRRGLVEESKQLFCGSKEKDAISWNAMISGLAQNGLDMQAIELFQEMRIEGMAMDHFTFVSVLTACCGLSALKEGKQVHTYVVRTRQIENVLVANGLIDMYSKCRSIEHAVTIFNQMMCRSVVSWTTMLAGYGQNGFNAKAVWIFREMQRNGIMPNDSTLGSVISSCANLASLEEGIQFHCRSIVSGLFSFIIVSNSLVNLYAKCGSIEDSHRLFNEMRISDEFSWTALISGYARFGKARETINLFEKMLNSGPKPDGVTFLQVLSACSRAGLVENGNWYFESMVKEHGIIPVPSHYACMVDLFSRAGKVDEARKFINAMPFRPDAIVWSTLLSSCRFHSNEEIGKWAADSLLELEPLNAAGYILLSRIYASKGKWDKVAHIRQVMREKGVRKEPGYSWIKHKNKVHVFSVDDQSNPISGQDIC